MRLGWLIGLAFVGCASTGAGNLGVYNSARREYQPAPKLRVCTGDADCVAADVDCSNACPGGGGINRAYLSQFLEARRVACSAKSKRPARGDEHTCVAAPVHCTNHLCAWAYDGPDPSTLEFRTRRWGLARFAGHRLLPPRPGAGIHAGGRFATPP